MQDDRSPIDGHEGRPPLSRDAQQWVFDYIVQQTGKTYHFQGDGRGSLPRSVRSHAMISKHVGRQAARQEALADAEAAAGHRDTATDLYFRAADAYGRAQHTVFDLNEEKRHLHEGLMRCYDKMRAQAPYPIERIEVEWEGHTLAGNLHVNPHVHGPAPMVFYIPGCDVTKEHWPHPHFNQPHQRGMHVFSFDGPGQGESNLRGIRLTADSYERAASRILGELLVRPEIDAARIVVYATSFGTYWGLRFAALDDRIRAIAAPQASIADKRILMDLEGPRWKQLFAFVTGASSEKELDAFVRAMAMDDVLPEIGCPSLLTIGEYDPRGPRKEVLALFDRMTAPAELWIMADQHHHFEIGGGSSWSKGSHGICIDWLRDRLDGKPIENSRRVLYVEAEVSPNAPDTPSRRAWYES